MELGPVCAVSNQFEPWDFDPYECEVCRSMVEIHEEETCADCQRILCAECYSWWDGQCQGCSEGKKEETETEKIVWSEIDPTRIKEIEYVNHNL